MTFQRCMISERSIAIMGGGYGVWLGNRIMPEMAACPSFDPPAMTEKFSEKIEFCKRLSYMFSKTDGQALTQPCLHKTPAPRLGR